MTKVCAEAMDLHVPTFSTDETKVYVVGPDERTCYVYNPLHDDAQAMALVKRFHPHVCWQTGDFWEVQNSDMNAACAIAHNSDLNRAVVECVAKAVSLPSHDRS